VGGWGEGDAVIDDYELLNRLFVTKYGMDFGTFRDQNIVAKYGYSFEVESDYCEWEMAVTGLAALKEQATRKAPLCSNETVD
jgi:hypothetical protein